MENKASKVVTSDDSALHEPQEGKADDAESQTPKRDYPEPSSSGRVGQPSSANKVETTGVMSNNDDKIKRAGEYMELVCNALGNNNFYEAEQLLKIVNHLDPHENTQSWLSWEQQKNLADETLGNASAQLEREAAERQRKQDEERLRKEEEDRKREAESEEEKQRQEAAEQRMDGLGAGDPQRPAARVRFPVTSLCTLTRTGFDSDEFYKFYVRGMEWRLLCYTTLGTPYLRVSILCRGPREELRREWRCAARGHVRVLRGDGAGEEEGRRVTFDHTFTDWDWRVDWDEFMSRDAAQALAAAAPGRHVTDQLILEVELAADPLDYI